MKTSDMWTAAERPPSRFVSEAEFAAVTSAADFAWEHGLYFNTHLTINWALLGAPGAEDAQTELTAFLKCQREWFHSQGLPQAWVYSHECGRKHGLHSHFAIAVPGAVEGGPERNFRREFRQWAMGWPQRRLGRRAARSIRVRGPAVETPWLHWLLVHYLLKGYDRSAIVQSARSSPDGMPVLLGDLISAEWRDPGPVAMKSRVGVSRSLGPERRAAGAIPGFRSPRGPVIVDPFRNLRQPHATPTREPFRSRYEDGVRDVRGLYPAEYLDRIRNLPALDPLEDIDIEAFLAGLDV
ncbi:hypothetical protein [Phenylobacterium ferrooxidans]|uniref:Uncharacterized protein n=1 Tax=Phenylobacterium ferrooxidans TaxID=2982689 RepID=A0ABW6CLP5_9CAUL